MARVASTGWRAVQARWQRRLLLRYPLAWRLHPLRGLLLAAMVAALAASVEPLVQLAGIDEAGRGGWYVALYLLYGAASLLSYLYWVMKRINYPATWLAPRVLVRVAWLDVAMLAAFVMPQAWFITQTIELHGDPAVQPIFWWTYLGLWAWFVSMLFGMLGLMRLSAPPWLARLLAKVLRWDLLLPAGLRARAARHEHRLAVHRPDLWRLLILRRGVVAFSLLALTAVPVGAFVAATGASVVGSLAILYVAGMFLMLQTLMAVVVPGDQQERPKWHVLALDAAVSAMSFTMLATAYEGVSRAGFIPAGEVRGFSAVALSVGSFWLAFAAVPILLSRRAKVLAACSAAACVTAGAVVLTGDGRVVLLATLCWALAAAWLSRVRPEDAAFERAIGPAVGVLAFAPLLLVWVLLLHFGKTWPIGVALLSSPVLGWVLARSALPVLRAARYWPRA